MKEIEKLINELEIEFDAYTGKGLVTKDELISLAEKYCNQKILQQIDCNKEHIYHTTDWDGRCYICGKQVFIRQSE